MFFLLYYVIASLIFLTPLFECKSSNERVLKHYEIFAILFVSKHSLSTYYMHACRNNGRSPFYLLSLAVDLHELGSFGVDVSPKISEPGKQARAHLRKYEKLKDNFVARSLTKVSSIFF